ncbi:MAG: hypothetical protein GY950_02405 [bacterium]|nr:hypothetical protein [bacterium]
MKRNILTGVVVILGLMLLQGCMSSPGKRYFQLHMLAAETMPGTGKVVLVEPVDVDSAYNDYRLVYRVSPYEVNYYSYQFWTKKPGALVRDAVVDYLSGTGAFKKVITKYAEGTPDLQLKARVKVMEEYDRKDVWFAHLKMTFEIKTLKTDETVLVHGFDRRVKLSDKKVEKVPMALSALLEQELGKMVKQLSEKLTTAEI